MTEKAVFALMFDNEKLFFHRDSLEFCSWSLMRVNAKLRKYFRGLQVNYKSIYNSPSSNDTSYGKGLWKICERRLPSN